jgi:mycothiol synthase
VITYRWYAGTAPDDVCDLRRMLADAAAEDDEAGFPKVTAEESDIAGAAHLLVWLVPDERPGDGQRVAGAPTLAAYLRLEAGTGGAGLVRFVVRPELRSRGIATMLFEQLGLDVRAAGGWAGTGVCALRGWARGDHPAADRMARRLHRWGVRRTRREWQLSVPLRAGREIAPGIGSGTAPGSGPGSGSGRGSGSATGVRAFDPDTDSAALTRLLAASGRPPGPDRDGYLFVAPGAGAGVAPGSRAGTATGARELRGAVSVDPDARQRTEYGVAGRITEVVVHPEDTDGKTRTRLLVVALESLRDKGLRVAAVTVDPDDGDLVRDCRLLGFLHDRTDCLYEVP